MNIEIVNWPRDSDWMEVKRRALVTVGKKPIREPDMRWKHEMLVQRHSPIRNLQISFLLEDIPYWLSTEFSRHVHAQPYIRSQRNDRQEAYDRNAARQDAPVSMIWDFNAESFMVCANKRLCQMASKEARTVMAHMCILLEEKCPEFIGTLVPMCIYHGHVCHESRGCGLCPYDGMEGDD